MVIKRFRIHICIKNVFEKYNIMLYGEKKGITIKTLFTMKLYRIIFFTLLLFIAGCSSIGLKHTGKEQWVEMYSQNALTAKEPDLVTHSYLVSNALEDLSEDDPEKTFQIIKAKFDKGNQRPDLSALVEVCALQARDTSGEEKKKWIFRVCRYSYFYLFDKNVMPAAKCFPTRLGTIGLYYNYSVASLFENIVPELLKGKTSCFAGKGKNKVEFKFDTSKMGYPPTMFKSIQSSYEYMPTGMISYSLRNAIGAPMFGMIDNYNPKTKKTYFEYLSRKSPCPLTVVFKFTRKEPDKVTVVVDNPLIKEFTKIDNRDVPLSLDITTPLAKMMEKPPEIGGIRLLFFPDEIKNRHGLFMIAPFQKDKIPVILVHGLMSNPRTWTQAINVLLDDRRIRQNYQFWYFSYSTGNPILYSASLLRKSLLKVQKDYDPDHNNPYFNRAVLIGHSMGGILSKCMVENSKDTFTKKLLKKPIDKLDITPAQRQFLMETIVFDRIPFIDRAIFVAAPHRGSEMAIWSVSRWASSLITLPHKLVTDVHAIGKQVLIKTGIKDNDDPIYIATGIDNLDPGNKALMILASLNVDSNVPFHSIVGNRKEAGKKGGSDGIVPYSSSHLADAQSEDIIKSGHSVHNTPEGIQAIKAILLMHLKTGKHHEELNPSAPKETLKK